MMMSFGGQCVADSLTGLDLGVGMRRRRRGGAGTRSSSRLPRYLDSLGTSDGGGVGENNLVYGGGVGGVGLRVGADDDHALLLVGRSYRGRRPT